MGVLNPRCTPGYILRTARLAEIQAGSQPGPVLEHAALEQSRSSEMPPVQTSPQPFIQPGRDHQTLAASGMRTVEPALEYSASQLPEVQSVRTASEPVIDSDSNVPPTQPAQSAEIQAGSQPEPILEDMGAFSPHCKNRLPETEPTGYSVTSSAEQFQQGPPLPSDPNGGFQVAISQEYRGRDLVDGVDQVRSFGQQHRLSRNAVVPPSTAGKVAPPRARPDNAVELMPPIQGRVFHPRGGPRPRRVIDPQTIKEWENPSNPISWREFSKIFAEVEKSYVTPPPSQSAKAERVLNPNAPEFVPKQNNRAGNSHVCKQPLPEENSPNVSFSSVS